MDLIIKKFNKLTHHPATRRWWKNFKPARAWRAEAHWRMFLLAFQFGEVGLMFQELGFIAKDKKLLPKPVVPLLEDLLATLSSLLTVDNYRPSLPLSVSIGSES